MKRRVLLAQALVAEPDILLLDEPTNHLDIDAIRWLEDFLLRSGGTLIFVTHDRVFLERLATRIVELDRGQLYDWACDYPTFLKRKEELLAAEERQNGPLRQEAGPGRGVDPQGDRGAADPQRGPRPGAQGDARGPPQRRERQGTARMQVQEAERSGTLVIEAKGVGFGYERPRPVHPRPDDDDHARRQGRDHRPQRLGQDDPDPPPARRVCRRRTGRSATAPNLEVAYFDQLKATLDEEKTVQQNVSDYDTIPINGQPRHVIGYLQDFLFPPERSRSLVKFLSGGERSRLLLAKLFTKPSNVLVLDEPTNDLDVETLELLESLLVEYQGTVLLVSHDRAFLNDVVTSTLAIEADGGSRSTTAATTTTCASARRRPRPSRRPSPAAGSRRAVASPQADRPRKLSFKERQGAGGPARPDRGARGRPRRACTTRWPTRRSTARTAARSPRPRPGSRRSKRSWPSPMNGGRRSRASPTEDQSSRASRSRISRAASKTASTTEEAAAMLSGPPGCRLSWAMRRDCPSIVTT